MLPQAPLWIPGWYHLIAFGLIVPVLALRSRARLLGVAVLPPRLEHFRSTTILLVLFGAVSIWVARAQRIDVFPRRLPTLGGVIAGVVLLAGLVAVMRPRWRLAVERRARVVYYFMPDTRLEQAWWIGVSILAGVSEEITWRGVQTGLLAAATQNYPLAAVITAVSFGLAHIVQGARSAAMIGLISLAFQTIVALSGSLYVAMAVHVAYDIVAGLSYGRLGRTLGYEPPAPVGPTPRVPQP